MQKHVSALTRKIVLVLSAIILSSFALFKFVFDKNDLIFDLLFTSLNQSHYSPLKVDDAFSEKVFGLYLKDLDFNKKLLLQSDIDELGKYRHDIDDEINSQHHDFYQSSLAIINKRIQEKSSWSREILSKPLDYNIDEEYETDEKKTGYAKTPEELKKVWEKMLKYEVLYRLDDMMLKQEKAKEKNDTSVKIKSFDSLEVDARRKTLKSHEDWFKRLNKITPKDRFSQFANAITGVYDPHTEYFVPKDRKKFGEMMSGQFEGIGAYLAQKDGLLYVKDVILSGPSYRQGELKPGDFILKVAQGASDPVDVTNMDMEDAIELIKGKKGTEVRLTVKKTDNSIKVIPVIRDVVEMEDTFAKSALLNNKNKIGYIYLPEFYTPFNGRDGRHCANDIRKEIEKLKKYNIKGLILDVRDNGGGSLQEVVEMAGLFISRGPVVQVKGKIAQSVLEDKNPDIVWDGPLSIMINHNSASASEILAAAIQDYKRGVIIGTQSFGKGTVQTFIDLDNLLLPQFDSIKPVGQVKITQSKFYRINGGATQIKGVTPDIVLPDPYEFIDTGEKELDNPMPWDEISKAEYKEFTTINYPTIIKKSKARTGKTAQFDLLEQQAKEAKLKKEDTKYSLKLDNFRAERKQYRDQNKKYDDLRKEIKGFETQLTSEDKLRLANDTSRMGREERWAKAVGKDPYIYEASNVLNDMN